MRCKFTSRVFIFLLLLLSATSLMAESLQGVEILNGNWKGHKIEFLDKEVLIGLNAGKSQDLFDQEIESFPLKIVRPADRFGFMKVTVNDGNDLFAVIEALNQLSSVRYAEPNMVDRLLVTPDDPLYNTQWHYHNTGQIPPGGSVDADIDAPEGWEISTGQDTIMVGVLDSGIPIQLGALSHPDLDDPTRFFMGMDIVNNDMEPTDDNGHGTHVSGTIAAESDNGIGVAGVAWNVRLMAIKVFNSSGSGSHEYFRDGCIYGVDNGCKVLNYSGGGSAGETKEHGVAYADSNGVILCAAAGNNWQGSCDWPGAYSTQYDNVICVSATDHNDASSPFSSIGPQVTIAAPGGYGSPYDDDDIQSTFPNYSCYLTDNYGLPLNYSPLAGTSMATPHVAGFAALILSMNPGLTPDSVKQIMMNTADDLGPTGFDNQFGYGRINVFNALSQMGDIIITHTPLEDTRDSLNDYEVTATIWSLEDLVADSLLLRYEISSVWYEETMVATGLEDEFHAFIPAQSPGTNISYYLYAQNIEGSADTTDTYSFYIIDYGVILEPSVISKSGPSEDTVWFDMLLINNGIFTDDYSITGSGNIWATSFWSEDSSTQIAGTGTMDSGDSLNFLVRVLIPSTIEGDNDSVAVTATSSTNGAIFATSVLTTISTGQPWEIPFTDLFITTDFDITKWETTDGAEINDIGIGEPTAPYSVNLNGYPTGDDAIISEMINLADQTNIIVKYAYQQTGGGESPDADDNLIIEYFDADSVWNELQLHLGSEPDMTEFEEVELILPAEAMHGGFRLMIRCTATAGAYDDWFVDDIYIGHPSDYDVQVNPSFQSEYGPAGDEAAYSLTVVNQGYLDDSFDLSFIGGWNVTFYDATGINPISSTSVIPGGDSANIVVKIEVPPGTPLHTVNSSTVYVTSQGDSNISAYALIETISAGTPASIPWSETFPTDTLYTQRWFTYQGATITATASGTPSMPYSMNLDGGIDTVTTQIIDLSGTTGVLLSYYFEMGGSGDIPETGDNLWVDYRNSIGSWQNLNTHLAGSGAMTQFEFANLELPPDAHHSGLQIRFRTFGEDPGTDDWFLDNIRIDYAPDVSVSPGLFSESLAQGDSTQGELIINNSGAGGLSYNISIKPHLNLKSGVIENSEPASHEYPDYVYEYVEKGSDISFDGYQLESSKGGPDNYGYYWITSDEPGGPVFEWLDVSSVGIDIVDSLEDDTYSGPYDLGFDFVYYGITYNQIYIGANGTIGFAESGMDARISRPIPTSTIPNNMLAWFWDDLNPEDDDNIDDHVFFHTNGEQCVIQFEDYPEYRADPGDVITAEVILGKDGRIRYQYSYIAPGLDNNNCAVGIENWNGTDGLEVVYHTPYIKDNLVIEFFKPYDWLLLDNFEGEIPPGGADTIACQFVTTLELDTGTYISDILITNNDPDSDTVLIGAELVVLESIPWDCGDVNDDLTVNVSDAVFVINYVFVEGSPSPDPIESGDVNCDSEVNVSDAVYIINYVFVEGSPVPCEGCK
jgi:Subtilase family/Dockerin type I domain/Fervidolysin N-terminal prodomain